MSVCKELSLTVVLGHKDVVSCVQEAFQNRPRTVLSLKEGWCVKGRLCPKHRAVSLFLKEPRWAKAALPSSVLKV